jgi:hypothetical protein
VSCVRTLVTVALRSPRAHDFHLGIENIDRDGYGVDIEAMRRALSLDGCPAISGSSSSKIGAMCIPLRFTCTLSRSHSRTSPQVQRGVLTSRHTASRPIRNSGVPTWITFHDGIQTIRI